VPRYVTVANLKNWRAQGIAFAVIDVETDHDITELLLA
jgi:polyhydroxyalkanoate synthesis regulator protein